MALIDMVNNQRPPSGIKGVAKYFVRQSAVLFLTIRYSGTLANIIPLVLRKCQNTYGHIPAFVAVVATNILSQLHRENEQDYENVEKVETFLHRQSVTASD